MSQKPLPAFQDPPVQEVVMSVAFEPVERFGVVEAGLLWNEEFKGRFPETEEMPPWEMPIERFDARPASPSVRLQAMGRPPLPRLWFVAEGGAEFLQVQKNWFARNWKKVGDQAYPRFQALEGPFEEDYERFRTFVERKGMAPVVETQCEITYVNHIFPDETVWKDQGDMSGVLTGVAPPPGDFLPTPEATILHQQYVMPAQEGRPGGRLYVAAQPGYSTESETAVLQLTLTARGRPIGTGVEGVMAFLRLGREWIVRGFAELTTPEVHQLWRRVD